MNWKEFCRRVGIDVNKTAEIKEPDFLSPEWMEEKRKGVNSRYSRFVIFSNFSYVGETDCIPTIDAIKSFGWKNGRYSIIPVNEKMK